MLVKEYKTRGAGALRLCFGIMPACPSPFLPTAFIFAGVASQLRLAGTRSQSRERRLIDLDNIGKGSSVAQGAISDEINRHFEAALQLVQTREPNFQAWRELRNRATHPAGGDEVDRKTVAAMVTGIRALLDEIDRPDVTLRSSPIPPNTLTRIQGEYAFVPTSAEDFLRRKREDIELENRR